MKRTMKGRLELAFSIILIGFVPLYHANPITLAPGTLSLPGGATLTLTEGEQFRLVYVTADQYAATSSNIATYNTDVDTEAPNITALAGLAWTAIASTETTSALQNITPDGVPVYNFGGYEVAPDDGSAPGGLFSGSDLLNPILYDEHGTPLATIVWTGTQPDGTPVIGYALGDSLTNEGSSPFINHDWITTTPDHSFSTESLYGVSDLITVSSDGSLATPEPGTVRVIMIGGMFLVGKMRSRRTKGSYRKS